MYGNLPAHLKYMKQVSLFYSDINIESFVCQSCLLVNFILTQLVLLCPFVVMEEGPIKMHTDQRNNCTALYNTVYVTFGELQCYQTGQLI